jgi:arylsulfatase A-like enzyme
MNWAPVVPRQAITDDEASETLMLYDEEVAGVDREVARIWTALERSDRYDEALIILTADHGQEFWEHNGVTHGGKGMYDEVISVPLEVKLPASAARLTRGAIGRVVPLVDLYPTVADVLGFAAPRHVRGESLLAKSRSYSISEVAPIYLQKGEWRRAWVDDRYTLIVGMHREGDELRPDPTLLFDMRRDPAQQHNVAAERPETVRALTQQIEEVLAPK